MSQQESNKKVNNSDLEKTVIVNQSEITGNSHPADTYSKTAQHIPEQLNTNQNDQSPVENKSEIKNEEKGISKGVFAAGVATAAVAGTALGTAYSDEIKSVFQSSDKTGTESETTNSETITGSQGSSESISDSEPKPNLESDSNDIAEPVSVSASEIQQTDLGYLSDIGSTPGMNTLNISSVDAEGNIFSVSMIDLEGDGQIDISEADIQLVDGTTISYIEIGEPLDEAFMTDPELASYEEFSSLIDPIELPNYILDSYPEDQTFDYTIQDGDTLSEIAAANNTSIERLMELNPEIADPNLIYSGNQLVIPTGDQIDNPYETRNEDSGETEVSGGELEAETEGIMFEPSPEEISQINELNIDFENDDMIADNNIESIAPAEPVEYAAQSQVIIEEDYNLEEDVAPEEYELLSEDQVGSEYELSVEEESIEWSEDNSFSTEFEDTDFTSYESTDSYEDSSYFESGEGDYSL